MSGNHWKRYAMVKAMTEKKPYESPWDRFVRENDQKLLLVEKYGPGWHLIQYIRTTPVTAVP